MGLPEIVKAPKVNVKPAVEPAKVEFLGVSELGTKAVEGAGEFLVDPSTIGPKFVSGGENVIQIKEGTQEFLQTPSTVFKLKNADPMVFKIDPADPFLARGQAMLGPVPKPVAILLAAMGLGTFFLEPSVLSWLGSHFSSLLGMIAFPFLGVVMGGGSHPRQAPQTNPLETIAKKDGVKMDEIRKADMNIYNPSGYLMTAKSYREMSRDYQELGYDLHQQLQIMPRISGHTVENIELVPSDAGKDAHVNVYVKKYPYQFTLKIDEAQKLGLVGADGKVLSGIEAESLFFVPDSTIEGAAVGGARSAKTPSEPIPVEASAPEFKGYYGSKVRESLGAELGVHIPKREGQVLHSTPPNDLHITLIDPADLNVLAARAQEKDPSLSKSKAQNLVKEKIKALAPPEGNPAVTGIGSATDAKEGHTVFFATVEWPGAQAVRAGLGLPPKDFHVTLASTAEKNGKPLDVHGMPKSEANVVRFGEAPPSSDSARAQELIRQAEELEFQGEMYFIEGWEGPPIILRERARLLRLEAKRLLGQEPGHLGGGNFEHFSDYSQYNKAAVDLGTHSGEPRTISFAGRHQGIGFSDNFTSEFALRENYTDEIKTQGIVQVIPRPAEVVWVKTLAYRTEKMADPVTGEVLDPIRLFLEGPQEAEGYLLTAQTSEQEYVQLLIKSSDRRFVEEIHQKFVDQLKSTGSAEAALDGLMRMPYKLELFEIP